MPPIEVSNLNELQVRLGHGISRYYTAKGVRPMDLLRYQSDLGLRATKDLAEGKAPEEIKRNLQAGQADLLRAGRLETDFVMSPFEDETIIRIGRGGVLLTPDLVPIQSADGVPSLRHKGQLSYLSGDVMEELHYAGHGTRLESPEAKFLLTAQNLLVSLQIFYNRTLGNDNLGDPMYKTLAGQISKAGGFEAIRAKYANMNSLTLGDWIFIQKNYKAYQMASRVFGYTDEAFKGVLRNQRYDMILNSSSCEKIINHIIEMGFYGLDPNNFMFMEQAKFPMRYVAPDGTLIEDDTYQSQGNHGLIPLQSYVDGVKFMIVPQPQRRSFKRIPIASTDYKAWVEKSRVRLVRNVEDISQLERPYDWSYIGLMDPDESSETAQRMFMRMALQKTDNPQRCGFLCGLLATGRNIVYESDVAPEINPADIQVINDNNNGFSNPLACDMSILGSAMADNLHPTFVLEDWLDNDASAVYRKSAVVRLDLKSPQGDRSHYLPTRYVLHEPNQPIENLKDMIDILNALRHLSMLETDEVIEFARNFMNIEIRP